MVLLALLAFSYSLVYNTHSMDRRVLQIGCGGVGTCVVGILNEHPSFDMRQLTILDQSPSIMDGPSVRSAIQKGARVEVAECVGFGFDFCQLIG